MSAQAPAVLVVQEDGCNRLPEQGLLHLLERENRPALLGGRGVASQGAEGLPCQEGCTHKLLASGMDRASHTPFRYAGQLHQLSCVPVDGCRCLRPDAIRQRGSPGDWQSLTPRELSVLQLLADGERPPPAPRCWV